MSAIFGIINMNGDPVKAEYLETMKNKISHYGMDAQDFRYHNNIGLGCCSNHISNYSQSDTLVLYDAQHELTLVSDAVIYNREELFHKYLGNENKEISTQAFLMKAFIKWGEDFPKYLNGDFTVAIWDHKKKRCILIRDHLGVRPIYYFYNKLTFAFATDYRALLKLPFVGKQLDEIKFYALLSDTYHIDTESTYFAQIKRLPQAHIMCMDEQGVYKRKYWTPGAGKKIVFQTEEEYASQLYKIVDDAVRLRVNQTNKKIGSEISGGLDSSVVTVLASRELNITNKKLIAYSWSPSFELLEQQEKDERLIIQKICEKEDFECRFRVSSKTAKQEADCKAALTDGYRSEALHGILEEMSSEGIRCMLSGWGGDEGISHRADIIELIISGYLGHFLKEAKILARGSLLRLIKVILSVPVILLLRPYSIFGTQNKGIPRIVKKEYEKRIKKLCKRDILAFKINPIKHIESGVSVSRTEIMAWLGADYNIQYMFPLLDYRVIDYAMSIPKYLYYKQATSRYIYRKAFEKILPHELCYNTSKIDNANVIFIQKTDNSQERAEITSAFIHQELFVPYIDWNIITKLLEQKYFLKTSRGSIFTLLKIQVCYDIQRLLDDALRER